MCEIVKNEYSEKYKRLLTIPGIGEVTAIAILAEISDIGEFLNARQLAAYIGVTPKQKVSGTSVHKQSRISKIGNSKLRKALYLPAITAMRSSPPLEKWSGLQRGYGDEKICLTIHLQHRIKRSSFK